MSKATTSTLFDLTGRVALVTGGSRGIGKGIARGLGEAGAALALAGRDPDSLAVAADELGDVGGPRASRPSRRTSPWSRRSGGWSRRPWRSSGAWISWSTWPAPIGAGRRSR